VCSFATVEAAVNAVIQTIQAGVPVARIEVANAIQMDAINKYSKLELPVAPTLWLEFHGTEASVAEQAEMVQKITGDFGGRASHVGKQVFSEHLCTVQKKSAQLPRHVPDRRKNARQMLLPPLGALHLEPAMSILPKHARSTTL
jgi:FAD linked oxidases, C-terminal domain